MVNLPLPGFPLLWLFTTLHHREAYSCCIDTLIIEQNNHHYFGFALHTVCFLVHNKEGDLHCDDGYLV